MSYLAILGRQPELSLAELEAVMGADAVQPIGKFALLARAPSINRLGGIVKLAKIATEGKNLDTILAETLDQLPHSNSKLSIGLSYYGRHNNLLRLGMQVKKMLKASHNSVRLVLPKPGQSALSAAQLKFNNLATPSAPELIVLEQVGRTILAVTEQYQDIDAYSARDFARPGRDAKIGMLPPKLAQILVNLAGIPLGIILDPFCGSGVILQEARLMGFGAVGSDISPAMTSAASENMQWLDTKQSDLPSWNVHQADARLVRINPRIAAVVTEGYLGPAFTHRPTPDELTSADQQVSELAGTFLKNLAEQTKPGFIVVMCLPAWNGSGGLKLPAVVDEIFRLGYTLRQFSHVDSGRLVYLRPGQTVGRKILVMRHA